MPLRLLELCPADWLNLHQAFPLQDKVALTYRCLSAAEMKSTIGPAVALDGAFLSCTGPLDSERKCGVLEQTHELWVFLDLIHRPHSSSFMRWSEFSPRRWEDFLWVNPYLCTEQSGCPALPSLQPTPTPWPGPYPHSLFIVCPPLSHIWTARIRYPEKNGSSRGSYIFPAS